jgi:small nuclear ribonucleoprotein B and B'
MNSKQSKFLQWINYRVRVNIQDNRMLVGTFIAFDKHMNLVLVDTEEFTRIKSKRKDEPDKERKRALGLVLLRGENIISFSAESPPSQSEEILNEKIKNITEGSSQPFNRGGNINNNEIIGNNINTLAGNPKSIGVNYPINPNINLIKPGFQ